MLRPHARDAQIDDVRAVRRDDDVLRGKVAVDDAMRVQFADRLADLPHQRDGVVQGEPAAPGHHVLQRVAFDVVDHHHETVGKLVGGFDMRQTAAGTFAKRRPDVAPRQLQGDLFAHERSGPADADDFGDAAGPAREHAFDVVRVIEAHGVHDLFVFHVDYRLSDRPCAPRHTAPTMPVNHISAFHGVRRIIMPPTHSSCSAGPRAAAYQLADDHGAGTASFAAWFQIRNMA